MAKRRGLGYWGKHLDAFYQGELTQREYCAKHGLHERTFYCSNMKQKQSLAAQAPLTLVPAKVDVARNRGVLRLSSQSIKFDLDRRPTQRLRLSGPLTPMGGRLPAIGFELISRLRTRSRVVGHRGLDPARAAATRMIFFPPMNTSTTVMVRNGIALE
jgi:hypothetical protein